MGFYLPDTLIAIGFSHFYNLIIVLFSHINLIIIIIHNIEPNNYLNY